MRTLGARALVAPVGIMAAAVVLTSCAGASSGTGALAGPAAASAADSVQSVTAVTGSIESTLVLPATAQASPAVTITARLPGRYAVRDGRLTVTEASGRSSTVPLPQGVVLDDLTVAPSASVPVNHPVATGHAQGFALVASVSPSALYRLYRAPHGAQGQIDEGPGPFGCALADPVPRPGPEEGATLTCVVPSGVPVFAGLTGVVSVVTGAQDEAVLLPLEAIAGDATTGSVLVLAPGRQPETRQVQLGVSDGSRIAVTSGLRAGETVRIPGPDLGARS